MVDTWVNKETALMAVKQDDAQVPTPEERPPESVPSEPAYRPGSNPAADEAPSTSYDITPDSMTLLRKFTVHPTSSRRLQGMADAALMFVALLPTAIFRVIRAAMGLVGVTEHRWRGISMLVPLTYEDRKQLELMVQNLVAGRLGRRPEPPKRGPVPPAQQLLLDVHAILAAATTTAASFGLPYEGIPEAALHAKLASYLRGVAESDTVCTQDCFKVMRKMGRKTLRSLCAAAPRMPAPAPPPSPPPAGGAAAGRGSAGPSLPSRAAKSFLGSVLHSSPSTTRFMSRPRPRDVAKAFNTACLMQQCASQPDTLLQLVARLPDGSGDIVETMSLVSLAPGVEYLRLLAAAAAAEGATAASELFTEQLETMEEYGRLRPSDAKKEPGVQGMAINARIHEVGVVRYGMPYVPVTTAAGGSGGGSGGGGRGTAAAPAGAVAEGKVSSGAPPGSVAKKGSKSSSRSWTLVEGFEEEAQEGGEEQERQRGEEEEEEEQKVAAAGGGGRAASGRQSLEGSEGGSEPDDTVGLLERTRRHNGHTSSISDPVGMGPLDILGGAAATTTTAAAAASAAPADPLTVASSSPTAADADSSAAAATAPDRPSRPSRDRNSPTPSTPLFDGPSSSRALTLSGGRITPSPAASPPKPSAGLSFFARPLPPGFVAGSGPSTSILHYPTAALDVFHCLYACPRSGAFAVHGREPRGVGLSRLVTTYATVHSLPAASQAGVLGSLGFRSVDELRQEVELRRALCVAQALPVIVASLRLMVRRPACLLAAQRTGSFLHVQQSLLSDLHRHERGYLEDTKGALDALGEKLVVRFVEGSEKVLPLHLSGTTITVSLPCDCVPSEALAAAGLTRAAFCSGRYGLTALLFNQGINSLQSLGFLTWRPGAEAPQDTLNRHSLERLNEYALRANRAGGPALAALNRHYGPEGKRPPKDTAMFALVRRACAEVGGGRAVNCKSGKDRTALEVSKALAEEVVGSGLVPAAATDWLEAQFLRGLSYVSTSQNHGQPPAYAFNEMEIATLPAGWRPDWRLCGKVAT